MKYGTPKFSIPLVKDWILVVTSTGNRFFHNLKTKESRWTYPNKQVEEHVRKEIDVDELLVLIAKARGLKIDDGEPENEEDPEAAEEAPADPEVHQEEEPDEKPERKGLAIGYDSSSEEEEEPAQASDSSAVESMTDLPTDESDAEGGLNLSDLQSLESESGGDEEDRTGWGEFMEMLDNLKIDKYASWDLVVDKVASQPAFYSIPDNNLRKACFDHWSQQKEDEKDEKPHQEESELARFVTYVQSRPKMFNYYAEFKRRHRADPEFKNIGLGDKEREVYYKELVKCSKTENKAAMLSDIVSASSVIKRALQTHEVDPQDYEKIIEIPEVRNFLNNTVSFMASDDTTKREGLLRGLQSLK